MSKMELTQIRWFSHRLGKAGVLLESKPILDYR